MSKPLLRRTATLGAVSVADRPGQQSPRSGGLLEHQALVFRPVADLTPARRNPRVHSPKQIRQIAASIARFGFLNPVLTDANGQVIAGHGRLAAAAELSLAQIPTLCIEHLSPAEQRAYVIADNRLAELAAWDNDLLAIELQELDELDLGFELTVTGFDTGDLDVLIDGIGAGNAPADEPEVPPLLSGPAVTRLGDLWQVGPHRLLCADATQAASYARLLGDERAQLVFTDPPFNVKIGGHVSGLGKVQHREFPMASGEMSSTEFTDFLQTVFGHLVAFSRDGSIHYQFMDWRHLPEILAAGQAAYTELKNLCVWAKSNGGMGSLYRSQHELVLVYKSGTSPHINNVELGKHGRYRSNVWSYAGANTFRAGRDEELGWHPTVKPVALVADAIRDCSHRHGLVLDAFAGSGTTLVAAQQTGRRGYGLELDPRYCDLIVRRLSQATGTDAVLAETGETFAATTHRRDVPAQAA